MGKLQIQKAQEPGTNAEIGRTPTGIPGLDELCEGGFEKESTVLVTGPAGCGKSVMLTQFIFSGALFYNEPGILLSLSEQSSRIRTHASKFGWDLESLEQEGRIAVLNYKPQEVRKLSEEGGGLIWDTISEIGAKRIAVDSLSAYVVLFTSLYQAREAQTVLFEMVQKWKCTTLLSCEAPNGAEQTGYGAEHLVDAVISLNRQRHEKERIRTLEILKMRGTNHSTKLCPFDILPQEGMIAYPSEGIFERI